MNSRTIYDYVERLSELLRVDARQSGADHGLQPVQLEVLHYLSICNRYSDTAKAVTEYLGQTKGTVSQTLMVLENKRLISKSQDKNDKRVSHLKITAKGERLLAQLIPTPMFTNACDALDDNSQQQILAGLNLLLTNVLQENNLKSFGVCRTCRYNEKVAAGEFFCNLVQQPLSEDDTQLICREHQQ